jgi:hypothetical protein
MSSDTLDTIDAFAVDSPDEESELRALAQALRLAEGFKLIFARCNQPRQQKRVIAALRQQLADLKIQEIRFDQPITHLLNALNERLEQPPPQVIFVSGLEYSLPTAADAQKTKFVANLNASRNSFPQAIPCPLVLIVPEYVLTAIAQGAPDFFSIRSGLFFFAATPGETVDMFHSLTSDNVDLIADSDLGRKNRHGSPPYKICWLTMKHYRLNQRESCRRTAATPAARNCTGRTRLLRRGQVPFSKRTG